MKKSSFPAYPRIIMWALDRLTDVLLSRVLRYGNGRERGMRIERLEAMAVLLCCLIRASCMQFGGGAVAVDGKSGARALSLWDLHVRTGLGLRRISRCLADLRSAGLIRIQPQIVRRNGAGVVMVSACLRTFTPLFWRLLGLWSVFKESVEYALTHGTLVFRKTWARMGGARRKATRPAGEPEPERMFQIHAKIFRCRSFQALGHACDCPTCPPNMRAVCLRISPLASS